MEQYLPIFALLVLAVLFAAISFIASRLLSPSLSTVEKSAPYECGIIPNQEPSERFPVKFYLVAMLFVIFDIEIIFLYPWAVEYMNLGAAGYFAILLFSALVFESFIYLISKGALDWGPLQLNRNQSAIAGKPNAFSTATAGVRIVGTEGRFEHAKEVA